MKKTFTTLLFLTAVMSATFGQCFTIDLSGGYCAPIAPSQRSVTATEYEIPTLPNYYASYEEVTPVSFGQGGCIALNLNWYSKKDFGCGLKLNAQIGSSFSHSAFIHYRDSTTATVNFSDKAFSFQFIPHISYKHDYKVLCPVVEVGMILGLAHYYEDYDATYSKGDIIQSSIDHSGGVMLGFYSSLGLQFKVSRVVRFSLAINCSVASYSPTEWTRTAYSYNYSNQLAHLYPKYASGTYVNQLDLTASQSQYEPSKDLKFSLPLSNIGFVAGMVFQFGKKHAPDSPKGKEKDDSIHIF